ncbi:MAG: hypothetical protein II229_04345, partial [Clostridia bacterium]|nr:hypothetical protein [Clostridia bacterium]
VYTIGKHVVRTELSQIAVDGDVAAGQGEGSRIGIALAVSNIDTTFRSHRLLHKYFVMGLALKRMPAFLK